MTERHEGPQRTDTDHAHAAEQDTLGATLERGRLTHRARRVEMVLAQLGERRRQGTGPVPMGLDEAIDGFSTELTHVRPAGGLKAPARSLAPKRHQARTGHASAGPAAASRRHQRTPTKFRFKLGDGKIVVRCIHVGTLKR